MKTRSACHRFTSRRKFILDVSLQMLYRPSLIPDVLGVIQSHAGKDASNVSAAWNMSDYLPPAQTPTGKRDRYTFGGESAKAKLMAINKLLVDVEDRAILFTHDYAISINEPSQVKQDVQAVYTGLSELLTGDNRVTFQRIYPIIMQSRPRVKVLYPIHLDESNFLTLPIVEPVKVYGNFQIRSVRDDLITAWNPQDLVVRWPRRSQRLTGSHKD